MEFIIHGSHFSGVLQTIDKLLSAGCHTRDVELVCNSETEEYILRLTNEEKTVVATIQY